MLKFLSVCVLIAGLCGGSIVKGPLHSPNVELLPSEVRTDFWIKWGPGIMEFFGLIDIDKVIGVFIEHLNDPEVLRFLNFILSSEFKNVVKEFVNMAELKEAYAFLVSKGYDVNAAIDFINSILNIAPFDKPRQVLRNGKGMAGFIESIIAALPMEDMKELFETRLEANPELAELFDTINSEEFIDILKRMSQNPKFIEIKGIFEGYGFDFKYICKLAKEIFGEYYQGIFCD